jgi:hypothetical protein
MIELEPADLDMLEQVRRGRVYFSRGRFFLYGSRSLQDGARVQRLRAMGLARLPQGTDRHDGRVPPTRNLELTDAGRGALGLEVPT